MANTGNEKEFFDFVKLNEYAQKWADDLAKRGVLEYRSDPEYGENIYVSFWRDVPEEIKPRDPIKFWYREGRFFKYGEPTVKNLEDVRHFAQLVWKETKSIGFGMATDTDGKIYLVCNYQPPGNVDGEFAKNVTPPLQADVELSEYHAEGIRITETKMEVVRSMERLYAVPSEKLRVWSVWLSKIGEIADEWQRWLRVHIDLAVRIAEQLEATEEAMRRNLEKKEDKPSKVPTESEHYPAGESVDSPEKPNGELSTSSSVYEDAADDKKLIKVVERTEDDRATDGVDGTEQPKSDATPKDDVGTKQPKSDATPKDDVGTKKPGSDDVVSKDKNATEQPDETALTSEEGEKLVLWPIGIPWQGLGEDKKIEEKEEELKKLPMPRNVEEMEEFAKKFTRDATLYRSYYKHWKETADRATKVIGGRLVLATFVVQGNGQRVKKNEVNKQASPESSVRISPPIVALEEVTTSNEAAPEQRPVESDNDEMVSAPETPTVDKVASAPAESKPVETSKVTEEAADKMKGSEGGTEGALDKTIEETTESNDEWEEVSDLARDSARADEPIPYFFYLKTEPDIEIAIEHDDEEVIPADTDREKIVGNYKRRWFNLAEKPGKGDVPSPANKP